MKTHPVIVSRKVEDLIPMPATAARTAMRRYGADRRQRARVLVGQNPVLVDGRKRDHCRAWQGPGGAQLGMEEVH